MHTVKRILRPIFLPLIAAVLLFEEWGWAPLAAAFARLARIPLWALLAFGVPMLLLPVKLLALYLFGQGQATKGQLLLDAYCGPVPVATRIAGSKKRRALRPAALTWYMAISACLSSSSAESD